MTILNKVQNAFKFIWEGSNRIFGPDDNSYPETGVQPFSGDPYNESDQQTKEV